MQKLKVSVLPLALTNQATSYVGIMCTWYLIIKLLAAFQSPLLQILFQHSFTHWCHAIIWVVSGEHPGPKALALQVQSGVNATIIDP